MISGSFKRLQLQPKKKAKAAKIPKLALTDFIPRLTIEEPSGVGSETKILPFNPWPAQLDVLPTIEHDRRVIFLKARQLGITWLILAYVLWRMIHEPGTVVIVFSQGDDESKELIERIRGMYTRYTGPKPTIKRGRDNMSMFGLANGSRVRSKAVTERSGRSFTGSIIIFDEYDFYLHGLNSKVFAAAKPAVDAGNAQLFIISTANGEDGDLKAKWDASVKGELGFTPVFLPWHARPDRDKAWYDRTAHETDNFNDHMREYPATPDEAFTPRTEERFVDKLYWQNCVESVASLTRNEPIVLAADAGIYSDCFALVGVGRHPLRHDDHVVRLCKVWEPDGKNGLDHMAIELEIMAICQSLNVVMLVYDEYQLYLMMQRIQRSGVVLTQKFSQQAQRAIADYSLLQRIMNRGIVHANQFAVLTNHLDNANRKTDKIERQLRIIKRSNSKKIDAAVALSMASYQCGVLPL